jgi:integrator complex subunit 2
MLNGYLLASKAYLSAHLKETAEQDRSPQNNTVGLVGQTDAPEVTREELKNALLAAQVTFVKVKFSQKCKAFPSNIIN